MRALNSHQQQWAIWVFSTTNCQHFELNFNWSRAGGSRRVVAARPVASIMTGPGMGPLRYLIDMTHCPAIGNQQLLSPTHFRTSSFPGRNIKWTPQKAIRVRFLSDILAHDRYTCQCNIHTRVCVYKL